jgi:hypothetical protein
MRPMHIAANAALFQRIEGELFVSLMAIGRLQSASRITEQNCCTSLPRGGSAIRCASG